MATAKKMEEPKQGVLIPMTQKEKADILDRLTKLLQQQQKIKDEITSIYSQLKNK